MLIEIDATKLVGTIKWVTGKMEDKAPDGSESLDAETSMVHYLLPEGCAHVYGPNGVPTSAIVRQEAVPLGEDGNFTFPEWL
jgi:uncharacterized protein (DUF952 family)